MKNKTWPDDKGKIVSGKVPLHRQFEINDPYWLHDGLYQWRCAYSLWDILKHFIKGKKIRSINKKRIKK